MARRPCNLSVLLPVLTTLAGILFSGPARAQLAVSAPTGAEAGAVGAWYQRHVPPRFRARRPVPVTLLPDAAMTAYLGADADPADNSSHTDDGDGSIDGVFEDDPPRITLRLPASGVPDLPTFAHEYGHYVWFQLLSRDDRARYAAIYGRQRAARRLVTDYAADCLEEGFAEAFSYSLCRPSLLAHRDPLSAQFLAQWAAKSQWVAK